MEIIEKQKFLQNLQDYKKRIENGAIFVYPTDTIYGIGCSALHPEAILKLRQAKKQKDRPFSVIAPSRDWVIENCEVSGTADQWLLKLPGPYTIILKSKDGAVHDDVNLRTKTLGIRLPNHWITEAVKTINLPIITTSVNTTGGRFMQELGDIDENVKQHIDFVIYEGKRKARPSTVVDISDGYAVVRRK